MLIVNPFFLIISNDKEFLNAFFARFRNSSGSAEQIVNNAVDEQDAPDRVYDLIAELEQLYIENIGAEGVRSCGLAISYAAQLKAMGASAFVPLVEIHDAVVLNDPDSSMSVGSSTLTENENRGNENASVQSMNTSSMSPLLESLNRTSFVGSTTSMSIDAGTKYGSSGNTLTMNSTAGSVTRSANRGIGSGSVESMDTSNAVSSSETPNRGNEACSTTSMSVDTD